MRLKVVTLCILMLSLACAHIPSHLFHKIKKAKSVMELFSDMHVIYHPEHTNRHIQKNLPATATPILLKTSSFGRRPSSSNYENEHIDDHTFAHLQNIQEIRQGNDTCKLQSVCVPIPQVSDDPQVVIYPRCYEVNQCVGSCCESVESCHPLNVNLVKKPIVELIYIGNNRFMVNSTKEITMEEHTSCSCFDCGANTPVCDKGFVVGRSCQCECENKEQRNNCVGHEEWNAKTCKCECKLDCGTNEQVLNKHNCQCERRRKHGHSHRKHPHRTRNRNEGREVDIRSNPIPDEDINDIPRLQVAKIGY